MTEPCETDMLSTLRDIFLSKSTLARRLALLEPTTKLARMLSGGGASCIETRSCSLDVPHGGFSAPIVAGRSPVCKPMNQEASCMQHHLYPADWRSRARACLEQAGYRCENCGIRQGSLRVGKHHYNLYVVHLHAAHVNHDPHN